MPRGRFLALVELARDRPWSRSVAGESGAGAGQRRAMGYFFAVLRLVRDEAPVRGAG